MFDVHHWPDMLSPYGGIIFVIGVLANLGALIGLGRGLFGAANPKIDERFAVALFGALLLLIPVAWLGLLSIRRTVPPSSYEYIFETVTLHSMALLAGIFPFLAGVLLLLRTLLNASQAPPGSPRRSIYARVICLTLGGALLAVSLLDLLDSVLFLQTLIDWSI